MLRPAILIVAASACLVFAALPEAHAQGSGRSAGRPRVNPYSDFLRGGSELYDPMVTPFMRRNTGITRRDRPGTSGSSLFGGAGTAQPFNPELARARARTGVAERATAVAPTGTGSAFMQYSHFYPMANSRRR